MKSVLLDQGLPSAAAELLRNRGWDAVHVREIAMRDATDREILARAAADGRICVTLDKDFHEALARSHAAYPSVILLRWQNLRAQGAQGVAEVIEATLTRYDAELNSGVAIAVSQRATRVRKLPLAPGRLEA
jgi:predicted nuclease of predicted toxin-antitoxin system